MKIDKITNIVWRLDCHGLLARPQHERPSTKTNWLVTKYQLYEELEDFVSLQKDYHRRLIHGHRNYYSWLSDTLSCRWFGDTFTYMFPLESDPSLPFTLHANNYDMVELFIRDAIRFGIDLTRFMSTNFDGVYDLRAGIEFENVGLQWWK